MTHFYKIPYVVLNGLHDLALTADVPLKCNRNIVNIANMDSLWHARV